MSTTDIITKKIQGRYNYALKKERELRQYMSEKGFTKNDPYCDPEKGVVIESEFRFQEILKTLESMRNTLIWVQQEINPQVSLR